MTLVVARISEAFYIAMASPPHARERWSAQKPLRMHRLLKQLLALGVNQRDAADAISDADRNWLQRSLQAKRKPKPGDLVILREGPGLAQTA